MAGTSRGRAERVRVEEKDTGDSPSWVLWVIADYRCDFQQIGRQSRLVVFRARQPLYVEACEGPLAGYRRAGELRERLEGGLPLVPDHRDDRVPHSATFDSDSAAAAHVPMEQRKESFAPAVVRTDLAGFILDANAAAARLLNIAPHRHPSPQVPVVLLTRARCAPGGPASRGHG